MLSGYMYVYLMANEVYEFIFRQTIPDLNSRKIPL